ncbi:hypothetical protein CQW23_13574 [Capsicum baccatum]|uniref:RING-type domain-containing protein n=1 Tax=Capsicum baccatum TaxID=33114 RepID=A0A2G2WGN7_CAPBA|nr:hypothetical protein CQW23_13574 [Capsicum baccatum]
MDPSDTQFFNRDEETDSQLSFDINKNEDDIMDDNDDMQLQQIPLYSAQFHSGKNLESSFSSVVDANKIEMVPRDTQIFNRNEETDSQLSFDINKNENEDDIMDDNDDIQLQQILFYSAQFHLGKNLESSSSNVAGKKIVELPHSFFYGSIGKLNSIRVEGESSCTYCDICEDVFPPNTLIQGNSCQHLYCVECIQKYIAKKINDDIHEVKCPIVNCKRTVDLELLLPYDVLDRVENANREAKVLASSYIMDCPYEDCTGNLVDDGKGYLI